MNYKENIMGNKQLDKSAASTTRILLFKKIFQNAVISLLLLFASGTIVADISCSTSDGLELSISSSGTVSSVKINNGSLPLLNIANGFSFHEICPNLIYNSAFDDVTNGIPDNWTYVSGTGTVTYDETTGHIGNGCMKIYVPGTTDANSGYPKSYAIDAEPGIVYSFSAWGKSSGVNGSNTPAVRAVEVDINNNTIVQHNLYFDRNSDWEKKSSTFTTNASTRKIYIYANIWSSYGTFWVDDIWLKSYAKWVKSYDGKNILPNPGFDYVTGSIPNGWSIVTGAGTVTYSNTEGLSNNGCMVISVPGTTDANSGYPKSPNITVAPDTLYILSAWGKVSGSNGTYLPCVRVVELDVNNNVMAQHNIAFPNDSNWRKNSIVFTTSSSTSKVYVYANIWGGFGTFLIDDIILDKYLTDKNVLAGTIVSNTENGITQTVTKDGIDFEFKYVPRGQYIEVSGHIQDKTGADRAINLSFNLPVNSVGWFWYDDVATRREISLNKLYENTYPIGNIKKQNTYPFTCVGNDSQGLSIGIPMAEPRMYHIGYNSQNGYFINYDLGVASDTLRLGSSFADFKFIIYKNDNPQWGFRSLVKKYYNMFPQYFKKKNDLEGIWLFDETYQSISNIDDFGFAFHVSDFLDETDLFFDKQHKIYSMQYTEPWGWWRSFGTSSTEPSYNDKITALNSDLGSSTMWRDLITMDVAANTVLNTAPYDEKGNMYLDHWALWYNWGNWYQNYPENPSPNLPSPNRCEISYLKYGRSNVFSNYPCMGFHLDSLLSTWAWAGIENYRRDHWQYTDFPLTFSYKTNQPVLPFVFSQYECINKMQQDMGLVNKRVDANILSSGYSFYSNVIDVFGSELWHTKLDYKDALLRRTMSGQKTNRNLLQWNLAGEDQITAAEVEEYMNDQMFYGMFPGIGISQPETTYGSSRYWSNPVLYERDRQLFKKYIPIIREVSAAGWEPVTYAQCSNSNIKIERFGRTCFTVGTTTENTESGTVSIDLTSLGFIPSSGNITALEMCSGTKTSLTVSNGLVALPVTIPSNKTYVYKLSVENAGHWKLNETSGSTAFDSSCFGNNGTLYNMTVPGCWIDGKGLLFGGNNEFVDCGNDVNLNITDSITIEVWLKFNSLAGTQCIVSKGSSTATNYWMDIRDSGNSIYFGGYTSSGDPCYTQVENCGLTTGKWYHIVGTYDRKRIKLYINGENKWSVEKSDALGINSSSLQIGAQGASNNFNGIINDVKLYHRALMSREIYAHYKQMSDVIGCWNLDESGGSVAYDTSERRNNGSLVNMDSSTCWVNGKIKNALAFDGADDYVNCGNDSSFDVTDAVSISAWIKLNSLTGTQCIVSKGISSTTNYWMDIRDSGNTIYFGGYTSSGAACYMLASGCNLTTDRWYHLVGVYNKTTMKVYIDGVLKNETAKSASLGANSSTLRIGARMTTNFFNGVIDEVKIYATALSNDDVSALYQDGVVKGSWTFDESSGCIAYDSSYGKNNGVLVNMDTETCRVDGQVKKALTLDGNNDFVNCGNDSSLNITDALTIEAWVKLKSLDGTQCIVSKGINDTTNYWMDIRNSGATVYFGGYSPSGTACNIGAINCGLVLNTWYHIVGTYDKANVKLYINGVLKASTPNNLTLNTNDSPLIIGMRANTQPFNGIIDELKIYNKALSASEIYQHFIEEN